MVSALSLNNVQEIPQIQKDNFPEKEGNLKGRKVVELDVAPPMPDTISVVRIDFNATAAIFAIALGILLAGILTAILAPGLLPVFIPLLVVGGVAAIVSGIFFCIANRS